MEFLIPIGIIALFILLNGLFVAAEFAIIGAPRSTIERRALAGDKNARRVADILHDPRKQDRYIATAQLGITFASLGLGMYGEHELAVWFAGWLEALGAGQWIAAHTLASVIAVLILTYFHIVVGEMVPKSLALSHAESTVLRITGPMLVIKRLLLPLVILLNGVGNGVLALLGVRRELSTSHYHSPEELELIIRESEQGGLLHPETGRLLRELFDFGELTAGEIAVPRVHVAALPLNAGPDVIAAIVSRAPHARYPVYERDRDHILGFVHVKDILRVLQQGRKLDAADLAPVAFVPATAALEDVLTAMHTARSQVAVVMDEHGGTAGIVTPEDLSSEILGATEDTGGRTLEWSREPDGRVRAAGTLRLDDLGELLGLDLAHDEIDSVSGLVLDLLGRPPQVGDQVETNGLEIRVVAVVGHGVGECIVTKKASPPDPSADDPDDKS